jgi:cytochrome P450
MAGPEAMLATLAVVLLSFFTYRALLHPLAHIPGPFLAKFTGWWRHYHYFRGTWHDDILKVHRKYGRIVRIAPNELSVVDVDATKQLYGHGHNAPKTDWYATWEVPNAAPGLFAARDKKLHAFLRKRVAGAYSMSAILKYEVFIQDCLDLMLSRLEKHAEAGSTVNMANWTNAFAFDVVGELAYGEQLGHLRTETDYNGLRKAIFDGFIVMSTFGHFVGQSRLINNKFVNGILQLLGVPDAFVGFQTWTARRVEERINNPGGNPREDMLSHFVRMKTDKGEPASFNEVLIEAMNIMYVSRPHARTLPIFANSGRFSGAGADTTSIGMRSSLYYICTHPDVYTKVQKEVDDFYESNSLDGPISYQQTQRLPFLTAVCKEAMRLLPSIVYQLLRHAPPGLTVDGRSVPAGTQIGISPLTQNRDMDVFGPDPDIFRPERWLEDPEKAKYMETMNMTFGGTGPRMCIGRNLALVSPCPFK